ncbi:hypothetical protein BU14_2493s0001 [Porphyra umbilicalis]|uniref:Uncharacterized protein n=1 Tax=Porphyra umbilicalis TaxID=2786 RepID=A0A1X6NJ31_PORUM|nr:hypothetical protein BU14_2493s0001 [Porphyra umbilicalis]|eukprot:OSX68615.1 hypothetical protein BU14_2493s0001 [Porphyra umbilicalis]
MTTTEEGGWASCTTSGSTSSPTWRRVRRVEVPTTDPHPEALYSNPTNDPLAAAVTPAAHVRCVSCTSRRLPERRGVRQLEPSGLRRTPTISRPPSLATPNRTTAASPGASASTNGGRPSGAKVKAGGRDLVCCWSTDRTHSSTQPPGGMAQRVAKMCGLPQRRGVSHASANRGLPARRAKRVGTVPEAPKGAVNCSTRRAADTPSPPVT